MNESIYKSIIYVVIVLFLALLGLNFYFRVKVLAIYQRLRRKGVEFNASHMFNPPLLEEEVIPRFPDSADDIRTFIRYVRFSISMASILLVLIIIAGSVLMFYR